MKLNDFTIGLILGGIALLIIHVTQSFPSTPGQEYGSAVFPRVVASGLLLCAVCLAYKGFKEKGLKISIHFEGISAKDAMRFWIVMLALIFYFFVADFLGFFLTAGLILFILFMVFGNKPIVSLLASFVAVLVIHFCFYSVLKVSLPWGILEQWAW